MSTNSAEHHVTSQPMLDTGFWTRTAEHLRQFICSLHGHDALLHFEKGRMSLLCTSCGYESPGWDLKGSSPRRETESPRVVRMPLVHGRRAA